MRSALLFALLALAPPADEHQRVAARDLERLESPDGLEAMFAARHLGRAGAVGAVPALWRLWRSEDQGCRWAALNALAMLDDERAVGWILDELRSDDPPTRYGAVLRLEAVGRRDLAAHLEPLFGDDWKPGDGSPCVEYAPMGDEARRVYAALLRRSLSSAPRRGRFPSSAA